MKAAVRAIQVIAFLGLLGAVSTAEEPAAGPGTRGVKQVFFELSPAIFVENRGQWDESVHYVFSAGDMSVVYTDSGPVFRTLVHKEDDETESVVFSATFVGANKVAPKGLGVLDSKTNYYFGNNPDKWARNVPNVEKMAYIGLYDGVDLYTWGRKSGLKYEFHVEPGASWEAIAVKFDGIKSLSIDEGGTLHVVTSLGEMTDDAPFVYQDTGAGRVEIASRFRLIDETTYAFEVTGDIDPALPLVIDPTVTFGSYLGGRFRDWGTCIAVDGSGSVWVAGRTDSDDFPLVNAFDTTYSGGEIFVARISAQGELVFASYLGGGYLVDSYVFDIAVDASGNAWVAGGTNSTDFPTTGGFDSTCNGGRDAYVACISKAGELTYGTYLGGAGGDCAIGIDIDASGNVWVAGNTYSSDFPTAGGFDTTFNGATDAFVARITPGGALAYATYLGGEKDDTLKGLALDAAGNAWVAGSTVSDDFPTPGGFQTTIDGPLDGFVARVASTGELAYGTYIGGGAEDIVDGIDVSPSGDIWLTGHTASANFPTPDGFDNTYNGTFDFDGFVARLTQAGALVFGSYLGGEYGDYPDKVAVDASGNAWVMGATSSNDFPTLDPFFEISNDPYEDVSDTFVTRISPAGELTFSTFLGLMASNGYQGLDIDGNGNVWVAGRADYQCDPPTPGGFDTTYNGGWVSGRTGDAFIIRISPAGIAIMTGSLSDGLMGTAYSETLEASGGVPPCVWSLDSGSLPSGLSLDTSGVISGTPSSHGTADFTVRVTDDASASATKALSITIAPPALSVTTSSLPSGSQGTFYSQSLFATGGVSPYTWSLASGSLPSGLSLGTSGVISGTPSSHGTASFTVRVTDTQPVNATKALSIAIAEADLQGPSVSSLATIPSMVREGIDSSVVLTATASDVTKGNSPIASAEYRIGAGTWRLMPPADGAFNSTVEGISATVDTTGWSSNTLLYVRAQDLAGNWSTAASILVPVVDGVAPGRVTNLKAVATNDFSGLAFTVADSSDTAPGAPLANLTDSAPYTFWQSLPTLIQEDVFVTLDLGSIEEISAVGLMPPRSRYLFPTEFMIETSEDGSDWDTVAVVEGLRPVSAMLWQFETRDARFIRISGPSMYDRKAKHFSWQIGEVGVYDCDGSSLVNLTWTAPADDGYTGSPVTVYDVRCGDTSITDSTFAACTCVPLGGAPANPGLPEQKTIGLDVPGSLYLALKAGDEVPNWSQLSNSAKVIAGPTGFMSTAPDDGSQSTADDIPTFSFAADATARPVYITFSSVPGFVSRTTKRANGRVDKTIKYPLKKGSTSWTPSVGQWKAIKKIVSTDGSLYWRLEGRTKVNGTIYGPARVIYFDCGEITDLVVSQADATTPHTVAGDALWPVKESLPFFTWTDNTVDMKYFYIDISSDPTMPMKDRKKSVTICTRGTLNDFYTATASEWLKIRRLATWQKSKSVPEPAEGVLYWRVRATDAQKALTCACAPQEFVVDAGTYAPDELDLSLPAPVATWTHTGEGIVKYSLEFCADGLFTPSSRETLKVPSKGRPEMFHAFSAKELSILSRFAEKKGVTELYWRVKGEDVQRAFISYSESDTTPAP